MPCTEEGDPGCEYILAMNAALRGKFLWRKMMNVANGNSGKAWRRRE